MKASKLNSKLFFSSIVLTLFLLVQISPSIVSSVENGDSERIDKRDLFFESPPSKYKEGKKKAASITEKKINSKSLKNSKSLLVSGFETGNQEGNVGLESSLHSHLEPLNVTFEDLDDFKDEIPTEPNETNSTSSNSTHNNFPDVMSNYSYFESKNILNPKMAMSLWIDVPTFNETHFVHEVLSNSHRRAASISLPFNFSFYGNNITKTTVATGGFLYMGEHVHSWLAATQYIAPLMANFDTRNSSRTQILYGYNEKVFVIQWDHVVLQEKPDAEFTFQCHLYANGDIAFVYKNIPIPLDQIPDSNHPVKIGVSDAYFIYRHQTFLRRKTIYEYHKVDLMKNENITITNQTAIFLRALPTCSSLKSCDSCLTTNITFKCVWCPVVQRCSDGFDRLRQEWVNNHCEQNHVKEAGKCPAVPNLSPSSTTNQQQSSFNNSSSATTNNILSPTNQLSNTSSISDGGHHHQDKSSRIDINDDKNLTNLEYSTQEQRAAAGNNASNRANNNDASSNSAHSSIAVSLFFVISIVLGISMWLLYAYRYPTTTSGQFLIRWRPWAWRWNDGVTRYTAASIHM